jgi:hypothetical protein
MAKMYYIFRPEVREEKKISEKYIKNFSFRVYFKSAVATRGCICEQKEKFGNDSQFSRQK